MSEKVRELIQTLARLDKRSERVLCALDRCGAELARITHPGELARMTLQDGLAPPRPVHEGLRPVRVIMLPPGWEPREAGSLLIDFPGRQALLHAWDEGRTKT
jgi:hypothetical protein